MANDGGAGDAERGQQCVTIGCQLLNAELITERLRRFAETDLVRRNDTEADLAEDRNGFFPGGGAEISSVQQHCRPAIGGFRFHVHVGHGDIAALRSELVAVHVMGIVETLKFSTVGRMIFSSRRRRNAKHSNEYSETEEDMTHGVLL